MSSVVIVGGGVGGLAAAIALTQVGHDVTVLEQSAEGGVSGASLGVQSNAAMALRLLGVAEPVVSAGVPVREYVLASWRGRELARWSLADVARQLGAPSVTVPRRRHPDRRPRPAAAPWCCAAPSGARPRARAAGRRRSAPP